MTGAFGRACAAGRLTALAVAASCVLAAGRVHAATACGTMITNVATATMTSGFPDYVAYEVSYNATVMVRVLCPPVVRLVKYASSPLCAAGCTVTFQVCVENQMTDSVWGITITDVLPANMTFVSMNPANYDMTPGWALGAVISSNAGTTAGPWSAGGPVVGQGPTHYLRWVIPGVGPAKSACVSYAARIL